MNFFFNKLELNKYQIYAIILFSIIVFRLPFFFTDEFNWDESTYIIMGQWILDGNLPYVDRTAVKPPLLYYLYALFVNFSFGEIFLIRFYTCLLLLINLIFLNKIFKSCFNKNFNFILISSFIFSSTYIIKDSNALFSENFAITFLLIGLFYFIRLNRNRDFFLLGFFLACACLVRLNLVIVPLIVFLYLILKFKNNLKENLNKLILYSFGGLLIIFLVFFPYILSGNLIYAWNSIIVSGTLMANNAPNSHLGALYYLLFRKSDIFDLLYFESMFRLIFWSSSLCGLIAMLNKFSNEKNFKIILFFLAIFFSIFLGARASAHYLILLNSICCIFVGYLFIVIKGNFYYHRIFLFSIFLCLIVTISQFNKVFENYNLRGTFYNGLAFDIVSHIKNKKIQKENIYIYKKHIAYWLLSKYPPTDLTHPSDINKEYLFPGWGKESSNKKIEMIKILDTKPLYLVLNKDISKFMNNFFSVETSEYKKTIENYVLDKKFDYIHIYIDKNYAG